MTIRRFIVLVSQLDKTTSRFWTAVSGVSIQHDLLLIVAMDIYQALTGEKHPVKERIEKDHRKKVGLERLQAAREKLEKAAAKWDQRKQK